MFVAIGVNAGRFIESGSEAHGYLGRQGRLFVCTGKLPRPISLLLCPAPLGSCLVPIMQKTIIDALWFPVCQQLFRFRLLSGFFLPTHQVWVANAPR